MKQKKELTGKVIQNGKKIKNKVLNTYRGFELIGIERMKLNVKK